MNGENVTVAKRAVIMSRAKLDFHIAMTFEVPFKNPKLMFSDYLLYLVLVLNACEDNGCHRL